MKFVIINLAMAAIGAGGLAVIDQVNGSPLSPPPPLPEPPPYLPTAPDCNASGGFVMRSYTDGVLVSTACIYPQESVQ